MIAGYRVLSEEELALINEIKAKGEILAALVQTVRNRKVETGTTHFDSSRWTSIGETHLQQGLMALVRAVSQPTNF